MNMSTALATLMLGLISGPLSAYEGDYLRRLYESKA
jgi:hypothetical protein